MARSQLPNDLITQIISLTSPQDACRASAVSTSFRSIADSDQVWLKFLPLDRSDLILPQISPMKSLYLHLCDHGVPVSGNQNTIFSLDKKSEKKCFMIGAREMDITWGHDQRYWSWMAEPNSRFDQVARLLHVWWFYITLRTDTKMLSPKTRYAAYLVFRFNDYRKGFHQPMESRVWLESDRHGECSNVILDPPEGEARLTRERGDGWLEIETGEFYNENGDGRLLCFLKKVDSDTKEGLIVEGIQFRPKEA
ncbi:hypothetical protein BT93_L2820 [Corymbia citriodora subsp. variegata]|uniref:F-box domain-containing protein n=1 Tax=Corymbia citriodora subsp. variegata TaxID=360336 RepID=A0A8T0CIQ4_CORYI|nr:hypothetical protein BT93_L2820 [Corymbia citriodora subsp. variegata]